MIFSSTTKSLHFVGIGGMGMSGIAEVLHNKGDSVRGSDMSENANVRRLAALGIPIYIGHAAENIRGAHAVVVSSAVSQDNPEIVAARANNIPVITRGEMLAEVIRLKKAVAISGTHGKTTTTSLIAAILNAAEFDPTVINGGIINTYQTNAKLGSGEWFVVEADESDGSFLKLPSIINVVTNIDCEHMNYYKTEENLERAFWQFIRNLPFYGVGVVCSDHPRVRRLFAHENCDKCSGSELTTPSAGAYDGCASSYSVGAYSAPPAGTYLDCSPDTTPSGAYVDRRVVTYGFENTPNFKAENVRFLENGTMFDVVVTQDIPFIASVSAGSYKVPDVFIPILGKHNVLNALAAIAVAKELGIQAEVYKSALASFKGVKRRFTVLGEKRGVTFVDDYAHHPMEIKTVIESARQTCAKRVIALFQPHRYSRFSQLFEDFVDVLMAADVVIALPVYAAGESKIANYDNVAFVSALKAKGCQNVHVAPNNDVDQILKTVAAVVQDGDFCIGLGAGSISDIVAGVFSSF
ncbi:MAG: UDP-N-acetylmuramate--L-alanine ligase [Holosporales bacterium]|nr:UDP-N-acetylmuramate--L-alanine ligase [Holosporales bacterium]